jgi:CrcB protein
MTVWVWIGVALLGGFASLARFVLGELISRASVHKLPTGIFVVNLTGAFALGLVSGLAASGDALFLIGTAMIGSYTTFSTWMLESHRLAGAARFAPALGNVVISLVAGFGAVTLGHAIGAQL